MRHRLPITDVTGSLLILRGTTHEKNKTHTEYVD